MSFNYQMVLILFQRLGLRLYQVHHKKHKTFTTIPPTHIYINRVNNTLAFEIKDGYKLELQTPETMKLFGSTKKVTDKIKNREKVSNLELTEVVLVQCNLVDNQYQQNSEVV